MNLKSGGQSRMTARGLVVALAGLAIAAPAPASAAFESCTYDVGSRTVTATLELGVDGGLYVGAGGEIMSGAAPSSGAQCGAATTANTDRIDVIGQPTLAAETVTIDYSGPGGAFRKALSVDEIAVYVDFGETPWTYEPSDVGDHALKLIGTPAHDEIRAGQGSGYDSRAVNMDAQSDADADVHLTNVHTLDLDGGDGDDHVTGLGGSGTVEEYGGRLVLRGGKGDDRLVGNRLPNVIYPGAGYDDVDGGGPGDDRGVDIVSHEDAPGPVHISYPHTFENNDGFGSRDDLTNIEGIRGSNYDDTLRNSSVSGITLEGAGGDDLITGGYWEDTLRGGAGDDHLVADSGTGFRTDSADVLEGGPGDDLLDGGQDPDALHGGAGDDVLNAGREESDNYPYSKRNWLDGGPGSDRLNGGEGDDTYEFHPPVGDETDTIFELRSGGRDTIEASWGEPAYGEPTTDHVLDLSSATTALGTGGTRTFRVAQPGEAANLEDVFTGWGSDRVTGNAAVNEINTGPGADLVSARDDVRDSITCGWDDPANDPDTAIVDALDDVEGCETVDRSAPSADPPPPPPAFKILSASYGRSVFKVRLPRACVNPSTRIRVRVRRSWVGTSPRHARLVRTTFVLDGQRVARDQTAPFATSLRAGLRGGTHTVAVRLRLKPPHHPATTRTLRGVVRICGA
jgi:RTX calcium-binding nonapeptide repeat (4 copies)